jgi:CRP-like cAMP-binding protein/CheY-like chemotaxis protein
MNTILLIEDNEAMRENTAELLNLAGYKVIAVNTGLAGLDEARKHNPNLILCDIMLPDLDGYGVLRALENQPELAAIPFVFLTAKSENGYFRKAMDQGADDYLIKPFNGEQLLSVVSTRLRKREIQKNKAQNVVQRLNKIIGKECVINNIEQLSNFKAVKKFDKKETIYSEGDTPNYIYLLNSGKVKTFKTNEAGKEYITEIFKDGDFFGYSCFFDAQFHQESAVAIENSEVVLIPREDFYTFLFSNCDESLKFIRLMAEKLLDADEKLLEMAYNSARKRVAEALLLISEKYRDQENGDGLINMNRENISAIAGIAPESVSRNLSDFRDEGLIQTHNGGLKILNRKRLEELKN